MQKKLKHGLVPSERYKDSRHLLLNAKVPKNVMGFSMRAQTFTPLSYLSRDSAFQQTFDFSTIKFQYKIFGEG